MRSVRIYTGADGRTHFEDLQVPDRTSIPVSEAFVTTFTGKHERPRHAAPYRRLVVILAGTMEIECADGSVMLGPGETLLADDTTGEGHITRLDGTLTLSLPLPESADIEAWR